jgi:hypothetical protein
MCMLSYLGNDIHHAAPTELGAWYERDWGPRCTHCVCAFPNTPKYIEVLGVTRPRAACFSLVRAPDPVHGLHSVWARRHRHGPMGGRLLRQGMYGVWPAAPRVRPAANEYGCVAQRRRLQEAAYGFGASNDSDSSSLAADDADGDADWAPGRAHEA